MIAVGVAGYVGINVWILSNNMKMMNRMRGIGWKLTIGMK